MVQWFQCLETLLFEKILLDHVQNLQHRSTQLFIWVSAHQFGHQIQEFLRKRVERVWHSCNVQGRNKAPWWSESSQSQLLDRDFSVLSQESCCMFLYFTSMRSYEYFLFPHPVCHVLESPTRLSFSLDDWRFFMTLQRFFGCIALAEWASGPPIVGVWNPKQGISWACRKVIQKEAFPPNATGFCGLTCGMSIQYTKTSRHMNWGWGFSAPSDRYHPCLLHWSNGPTHHQLGIVLSSAWQYPTHWWRWSHHHPSP